MAIKTAILTFVSIIETAVSNNSIEKETLINVVDMYKKREFDEDIVYLDKEIGGKQLLFKFTLRY